MAPSVGSLLPLRAAMSRMRIDNTVRSNGGTLIETGVGFLRRADKKEKCCCNEKKKGKLS